MRSPLRLAACAVATVTLLGACAAEGGGDAAAPATHTVTHEFGTVEVPDAPDRIVVLDEYAALTLLALDVQPDTVYQSLGSTVAAEVLQGRDIELTPAPTMVVDPDFESIAAGEPDLIVMISTGPGLAETFDRFNRIAPTLVLPYERTWDEGLAIAGAALGREERAAAITDLLRERITTVRSELGAAPASISVIGSFPGSPLFSLAPINPGSLLLADVGLTRPAAETGTVSTGRSTSAVEFSPENAGEHDADHVVVLDGGFYDAAAVTALPTVAALPATADGRLATANGEIWTGSFPLATWWVLDDLETLIGGGTTLGTTADAVQRNTAFTDAVAAG